MTRIVIFGLCVLGGGGRGWAVCWHARAGATAVHADADMKREGEREGERWRWRGREMERERRREMEMERERDADADACALPGLWRQLFQVSLATPGWTDQHAHTYFFN